ncbi:MAG: hypothetical protein ACOZAR_01445 [Patescibacteria group bacterium]
MKGTVFYGSHGFLKRFGDNIIDIKDKGKSCNNSEGLIFEEKPGENQKKYKDIMIKNIRDFVYSVKEYFLEKNETE